MFTLMVAGNRGCRDRLSSGTPPALRWRAAAAAAIAKGAGIEPAQEHLPLSLSAHTGGFPSHQALALSSAS